MKLLAIVFFAIAIIGLKSKNISAKKKRVYPALYAVLGVICLCLSGTGGSKEDTKEENKEEVIESKYDNYEFKEEIEEMEEKDYPYITPEELSKYHPNLEGVTIYTVTNVDDIKEGMVQSTLDGGYMMSCFYVGDRFEKYENILENEDVVAIIGTVNGSTSYGSLGTSIEFSDCKVFAKGADAENYKKDVSDSRLSDYFVINKEVAKNGRTDVTEEEYISLCKKLSHNDILRNPDSNKGEYCVVSGKADQIIEGFFNGVTIYVVDANGNKWDCYYMYEEGESRVLEGDPVTLYGECKGTSNSKTVLGKQVTLPSVTVKYIK